jgi:drug/metabolite transporter (DMT)-like permease
VAAAGYQSVIGGFSLLLISRLAGEPWPQPIPEAWIAWMYLLVFSSLIAFPSFVQVLRLLPANIGMTYAYVTPVGAVLLGWWLLGEPVTIFTLLGAALVLLGVAGVFHEQIRAYAAPAPAPVVA